MTPPRRWFRFSLRTMLVVVALLCCGIGWFERQLNVLAMGLNPSPSGEAF